MKNGLMMIWAVVLSVMTVLGSSMAMAQDVEMPGVDRMKLEVDTLLRETAFRVESIEIVSTQERGTPERPVVFQQFMATLMAVEPVYLADFEVVGNYVIVTPYEGEFPLYMGGMEYTLSGTTWFAEPMLQFNEAFDAYTDEAMIRFRHSRREIVEEGSPEAEAARAEVARIEAERQERIRQQEEARREAEEAEAARVAQLRGLMEERFVGVWQGRMQCGAGNFYEVSLELEMGEQPERLDGVFIMESLDSTLGFGASMTILLDASDDATQVSGRRTDWIERQGHFNFTSFGLNWSEDRLTGHAHRGECIVDLTSPETYAREEAERSAMVAGIIERLDGARIEMVQQGPRRGDGEIWTMSGMVTGVEGQAVTGVLNLLGFSRSSNRLPFDPQPIAFRMEFGIGPDRPVFFVADLDGVYPFRVDEYFAADDNCLKEGDFAFDVETLIITSLPGAWGCYDAVEMRFIEN